MVGIAFTVSYCVGMNIAEFEADVILPEVSTVITETFVAPPYVPPVTPVVVSFDEVIVFEAIFTFVIAPSCISLGPTCVLVKTVVERLKITILFDPTDGASVNVITPVDESEYESIGV